MSIRLVVFGLLSLRAVERTFKLFNHYFGGAIPCHVIIQSWVLRFGLFKLKQLPERRDDWVYILDHTIEYSPKQCLVVLGITLEQFKKNKCKITHKQLTVLEIDIVEKATALSVSEVLHQISEKTGTPAQIISDHGSCIKKGVSDFINNQDNTILQTYDVTHRTALILKHHLKEDEDWKNFINNTAITKRSLIYTSLGYLAPPKPKDKARWLNLDAQVKWAKKILQLNQRKLSKEEKIKYKEKFSWLKEFKDSLKEWSVMIDAVKILKIEVKQRGFNDNTQARLEHQLLKLNFNTPRLKKIKDEIIFYVKEETLNMTGLHPGCSDIIESVFGKYKIFSGKSPMKEVGKSVLTIPAFTCSVKPEEVRMAMKNISNKDVKNWLNQKIGKSFFSKRKLFLSTNSKNSVKKKPTKVQKIAQI